MDFYYHIVSAPCRASLLTARALGVKINLKKLDLMAGEQKKPEFLAINPQHCVPTLVDGDLKLWESRAISAYLVNQYGKNDSLYPKDPKKRAFIDRMLFFDCGTLFSRFAEYVLPVIFQGQKPDPTKLEKVYEALAWLDSFIQGKFVAGDHPTVADHALVASVSTFKAAGVDIARFPQVSAWLANCSATLPGYDKNEEGANMFGELFKSKLEK